MACRKVHSSSLSSPVHFLCITFWVVQPLSLAHSGSDVSISRAMVGAQGLRLYRGTLKLGREYVDTLLWGADCIVVHSENKISILHNFSRGIIKKKCSHFKVTFKKLHLEQYWHIRKYGTAIVARMNAIYVTSAETDIRLALRLHFKN